MPCMENIETQIETTGKKGRPKCPNCKKCLKYQQNYIENPYVKPLEQTHTIVMAHNLNILHYMYKKMVCKNLASVGYYIGGMSELELKNSEKKQIILASFSMSQEGLDIPTLNAEFLITPKTDIVQSVGRILRAKHNFSHPIIYDFIDTHDVFQRQWLKRKAFYKKQNYKIIGINSTEFNTDMSKWKNIFESKTGGNNKVCVTKTNKKQVSLKSNSSTDKSITTDSDAEESDDDESPEEQKDKQNRGKCLLTFKKK